jgi:hypothetical protein
MCTLCAADSSPLLEQSKMLAAIFKKNGGAEVLELVQDFPLPARKPGEVSCQPAAAAAGHIIGNAGTQYYHRIVPF